MALLQRDAQLDELARLAASAADGRGALVLVTGEAGAGKTTFLEASTADADVPVLWGACDPLSTPRPLGPIHDLADRLGTAVQHALDTAEQPHEIYAAVYERLATEPVVLVVDDLHWADQGTVDLLRFVLRRVRSTRSLVVLALRDDEVAADHPLRTLLGDAARSTDATTIVLPSLTVDAVAALAGDRALDAASLHARTGGNPFFVVEMLDHRGDDLPATVRDVILARTVGLDAPAWDLLNLLACAPEAIPDHLLPALGVPLPALRSLDQANLIRRRSRSVAFRHDLCRLAVMDVIPPGAEVHVHRRMIDALLATPPADPAVVTHHALGAGDHALVVRAASDAGRRAARSGAHTQAAAFFRIALDHGSTLDDEGRAELLELLAVECYLTDRLTDAIAACEEALEIRRATDAAVSQSVDHHWLAVYSWYNANRVDAEQHATSALAVLDGREDTDRAALANFGHALAMHAYLAVHASDLERARAFTARASEVAGRAGDPSLVARTRLLRGFCDLWSGEFDGRDAILDVLRIGPEAIDEIHSGGYSMLGYIDVEQRRLDHASAVLDAGLPITFERDLPICRMWQLSTRGRLGLLSGSWDDAMGDADTVLQSPSAPVARTWPFLTRALVALRRDGGGAEDLDAAWQLAQRYGESLRLLPAASAVVERVWLTGVPDERVDRARLLLRESVPRDGVEWSRGELAAWLRRLDPTVTADDVAPPYRSLLDGDFVGAADAFEALGTPYDAALALVDSGSAEHARRALDILDRLGADAVAAKVRRDLRARGELAIPGRRRATTRRNAMGLTARQVDVVRLLAAGATNAEIAEQLYLSAKTVDHHVSAILGKLQVTNRRDAGRRARELGIIEPEVVS